MKKHQILVLSGVGAPDTLARGELEIPKGKHMVGLRMKITLAILNATGAPLATGLSVAQRQALFALFTADLKYGYQGGFNPFALATLARIYKEHRRAYGMEPKGYTDTSTGLMKAMPDATSTSVVFWLTVPTGWLHFLEDKNILGVGRSQAKTVQLQLKMGNSAVIASGLTVNPAVPVTVELIPHLESVKSDRWCIIPEWTETPANKKEFELPPGLPLAVDELTAVNVSTALSNITVKIDDEVIHDQVSPTETITEYIDSPTLSVAASLAEYETLIYAIRDHAVFKDLPTGALKLIQNVSQQLTNFTLGCLMIPVVSQEKLAAEFRNIASNIRPKPIKAVNSAVVDGLGVQVPDRLKPFTPSILFDADDKEFQQYPGILAEPNREPQVVFAQTALERAQALASKHRANGENLAAVDVAKQLAGAVPGAVTGARGFGQDGSSKTLAQARHYIP